MGGRGASSGAGGGIRNVSLNQIREYKHDLSLDAVYSNVHGARFKWGDKYNDTSFLNGYRQRDVLGLIDDYGKVAVNLRVKEKDVSKWVKRIEGAGHKVKMQAPTANKGQVELLIEKKGAKISSVKEKKEKKNPSYVTYKG